MKTVLVCKNRKVAPKSQRKWKKYWGMFSMNSVACRQKQRCFHPANLKRSTLFLYECDEQSALLELETIHSDLKLGMLMVRSTRHVIILCGSVLPFHKLPIN